MKSTRKFVEYWGIWNRWKQTSRAIKQIVLAENAEHHLWCETPNLYREKDLGYQTVCGQRVKAKRVYDTANVSFLVLDQAFQVGKVG